MTEQQVEQDHCSKTCSKCLRELPATREHFQPLKAGKHGLHPRCRTCGAAYKREWNSQRRALAREQNPEDSDVKTCRKCQGTFPASSEYFYAARRGKYGLTAICKRCHQNARIEREEKLKQDPERYEAQLVCRRAQQKARGPRQLTDERRAYWREYQRRWAKQKREKIWAGSEDEQLAYLQRIRGYGRARYYRLTPAERNQSSRVWRQRRRANGGTLTAEEVQAKLLRQEGLCHWCGRDMGPTPHLDHVIPISKGGLNNDENTVFACPTCNQRKGNLDLDDWLAQLCRTTK